MLSVRVSKVRFMFILGVLAFVGGVTTATGVAMVAGADRVLQNTAYGVVLIVSGSLSTLAGMLLIFTSRGDVEE